MASSQEAFMNGVKIHAKVKEFHLDFITKGLRVIYPQAKPELIDKMAGIQSFMCSVESQTPDGKEQAIAMLDQLSELHHTAMLTHGLSLTEATMLDIQNRINELMDEALTETGIYHTNLVNDTVYGPSPTGSVLVEGGVGPGIETHANSRRPGLIEFDTHISKNLPPEIFDEQTMMVLMAPVINEVGREKILNSELFSQFMLRSRESLSRVPPGQIAILVIWGVVAIMKWNIPFEIALNQLRQRNTLKFCFELFAKDGSLRKIMLTK